MVPDIAGKGHSFAGAMRYYLSDKRQPGEAQHPTSSERVAWTEMRNLPVEDPRLAMRLMIATANHAETLKRQAGVKATGRRSTQVVYAFSLSWHPDEAPQLTRTEMLRAADSALAAIDAAHLQCVIVCHRDQPHPHVHCIVNRVDPSDGRMAVLSKDHERLSRWAHAYERERGPLLTPKRAERYGPEAERARQEKAERVQSPDMRAMDAPRPEQQARAPDARAPNREPSQRVLLAQLDAAQRDRHAQEWQALDAACQATRKAILDRHPTAKTIIAEYRKERQAMETALQSSQARDMTALNAKSRSLIGRVQTALAAAREVHEPGHGRFHLARLTIGFVFSPAAVRDHLAARQRSEREALAKTCKGQLAQRIADVKTARESELTGLTTSHGRDREAVISRQSAEKAKMKEAWRAAPRPERGKHETIKSRDAPERGDVERQRPERKRRDRNRETGRER